MFRNYSSGLKTNRDAWCYNFSETELRRNIGRAIRFYNSEVKRWADATPKQREGGIAKFITIDATKFSWDYQQRIDVEKGRRYRENDQGYRISTYRPFTRVHAYFERSLNNRVYQLPKMFPDRASENQVICLQAPGGSKAFSAIVTDCIPDLHLIGDSQCFPLYVYASVDGGDEEQEGEDTASGAQAPLNFGAGGKATVSADANGRLTQDGKYRVLDAITDEALERFKAAYSGEKVSKKDLFYYVYGLLHSEDYRRRYANNLTKELPHIPAVKRFADFRAFTEAGIALAKLHLGFDTAKPYSARIEFAKKRTSLADEDYRVVKMRFGRPQGGVDDNESGEVQEKWDRTTIHYNETIAVHDIPLDAYDYIVNGKSAIEWVMERQSVTTDKTTGITNDANAWAAEQRNAKYPLELLLRMITVSLETMKIVRALPALKV